MTKEYPYCKTQIRNDVSKCPSCSEWVNPWSIKGSNLGSVVYVLIVFAVLTGIHFFTQNGISETLSSYDLKPAEHTKIISSDKTNIGDGVAIIGEIKNVGIKELRGVSVEATFYDKSDKLINVSQDYIAGGMAPGETRPFKISFSCSVPNTSKEQFDHYKLTVR